MLYHILANLSFYFFFFKKAIIVQAFVDMTLMPPLLHSSRFLLVFDAVDISLFYRILSSFGSHDTILSCYLWTTSRALDTAHFPVCFLNIPLSPVFKLSFLLRPCKMISWVSKRKESRVTDVSAWPLRQSAIAQILRNQLREPH